MWQILVISFLEEKIASAASACPPKYGLEYQGCNLTKIEGVTSFEKRSKICFATQGCKVWTWYHLSNKCWLKKQPCEQVRSPYAISGDISTVSSIINMWLNFLCQSNFLMKLILALFVRMKAELESMLF